MNVLFGGERTVITLSFPYLFLFTQVERQSRREREWRYR